MRIFRLIPPPLKKVFKKMTSLNAHNEFAYLEPQDPKSPQNPWAFIRVHNEIQTLSQSLHSILPAIKRGVIVYNECTDGSDEIIKEFCRVHTGFVAIEYPYQVTQIRHKRSERAYKKGLADYYNFALSFIPEDEWLIKIDVDQIYDAKKLKETFTYPKRKNDVVYYFRLNLHCFDGKIYVDKFDPIFDPCDHWLICNQGLYFIESVQEESEEEVFSWELLQIPFAYNLIPADLNTWHFPVLKESRKSLAKIENYIHISQYKEVIAQEYLSRIAPDMLDEERILHLLSGGGDEKISCECNHPNLQCRTLSEGMS